MTRSLPENTVDAWTSIKLAEDGATWIWLPSQRQGRTVGGGHPGDISTILGRRLVLIENKGVEDQRMISLGSSEHAESQFRLLLALEDCGLKSLSPEDIPWRGWVFYGFPEMPGDVDGRHWREFPDKHHLICPHTVLLRTPVGNREKSYTIPIKDLSTIQQDQCCHLIDICIMDSEAVDCRALCMQMRGYRSPPLTLGVLNDQVKLGAAGLLLDTDEGSALEQIEALAENARIYQQEASWFRDDPEDADIPTKSLATSLQDLANLCSRPGGHITLAVL